MVEVVKKGEAENSGLAEPRFNGAKAAKGSYDLSESKFNQCISQ
jgi:hypothetical protein